MLGESTALAFPSTLAFETMSTRSNSLRLADSLASSPYSSVGCYPLHAVTSDGATLCHRCCKSEREAIGTTTGSDGWNVIAIEPNWEDLGLYCDHCGERIESAYAETENVL
jgi:hypothetical protein